MIRMLLKDCLTASDTFSAPDALADSPAKISKRMKAQPHKPRAKPIHGLIASVSPAYPKASMQTVPTNSFQKPAGPIGAFAAFRMRLNSIICRGTVMLQSMYLYTIGLLPTATQYSRMYM